MKKFVVGILSCVAAGAMALGGELVAIENAKQLQGLIAAGESVVAVDFWAEWCPSCSRVKESLTAMQNALGAKVKVVTVDIMKQKDLMNKYKVTTVPRVLYFKGTKQVYALEGLCSAEDYLTVAKDLGDLDKVREGFKPSKVTSKMGISVKQAHEMISQKVSKGNKPVVLDVRSNREFSMGALADAVHIPVNALPSRINELEKYKYQHIIVYCYSGYRSAMACDLLSEKGYKVFNLEGGIAGWQAEGYSLK